MDLAFFVTAEWATKPLVGLSSSSPQEGHRFKSGPATHIQREARSKRIWLFFVVPE